jgi:protocatechuate 3,4-dioxygenase beta subunit
MKRRNLLKGLGVIGLSSLLPTINDPESFVKAFDKLGQSKQMNPNADCWLTPAKTEGPYYFNSNLIRQDITEGRAGMPLQMNIKVINFQCVPIPNVMVDVWHCDKDGNYSGYNGFVGQTFMRGIQLTDASGNSVFNTVYPGWYQGRATHIHFKVRLSALTYVTSQFCFLDSVNNTVYATPLYSARGPNPTTNAADGIFGSANPQYLVMDAAPGGAGYIGNYTIGINATTEVKDPVSDPLGFRLNQNYPNPFNPQTNISYVLAKTSDVKLVIYNVQGEEITTLVNERQSAGEHNINFRAGNLSTGFYFYKLTAGDFTDVKEMLLIK